MKRFSSSIFITLLLLHLAGPGVSPVRAEVDLEWRTETPRALIGDVVEIDLYAVSDNAFTQSVIALEAILIWDASRLELLGLTNPCDAVPSCPEGAFDWMLSQFPPDEQGDGLNADCSPTEYCDPYTGPPYNDGDAFYHAFAPFLATAPATSSGLWVTTFRFRAVSMGLAQLEFATDVGGVSRTQVVGETGVDITGVLGPPLEVMIDCSPPQFTAVGSRYLSVEPAAGLDPVALSVVGDADQPEVSCVSRFLQADGTLGQGPVFLSPSEWGTAYLSGTMVIPGSTYHAQTICRPDTGPDLVSDAVSATTWNWGDVNDDGLVFIDDVSLVVSGSQGNIPPGMILENLDLAPCVPDGVLDSKDIAAVQDAFNEVSYSCPLPCGEGLDLDDLAILVECMAGPELSISIECEPSDFSADADVDLDDFAVFQNLFGQP